MFEILAKFFKFSGKENENKFKLSIVIGLVEALASAMKIPAIMYVLIGLMSKEAMGKYIIGSIAIMGIAVAVDIICKRFSTVLQTEGGYNASAFTRIKIAEHLRYLPMGYFNSNSIGEISSVTTNTMEVLGDIAARVVMLTTQGILETTMIVLMILIFDWRIGLISAFMLYSSLECAGNYSSLLHVVSVCVDKANAILELDTMDIDGKEIKPQNCDIKLDHISFSYDKRKIIDDVSLSIPEKTTTAIVGPSGGGKSTLCNLIARFWDVDAGKVTLGGVNVKDYSMNSLMNNFSFVFQTVYLFADTIENNIKFGRQDATHEEVVAAAKKACCHEFISQLPNGYNTVIGEGGSSLSGGQKQRISIARAIMKDAPVVILDEATANVDPENEKDLMDAIEALTKEKTIIMIAHRLKTVRHADQIVVVDKGRIVQQGTHEQLMTQDGIYKRFVDAREQAVSWKLAH